MPEDSGMFNLLAYVLLAALTPAPTPPTLDYPYTEYWSKMFSAPATRLLETIQELGETPGMEAKLGSYRDLQNFPDKVCIGQEVDRRPLVGVHSDIQPKKPPENLFRLSLEDYTRLHFDPTVDLSALLPPTLVPPPPACPPPGSSYPQSPVWTLVKDNRYQSGWIYKAEYYPEERKDIDGPRMYTMDTPPGIVPTLVDGCYVSPTTVAKLAWGTKKRPGKDAIPHLCHLEGLKRNDCLSGMKKLPSNRKDGSYSLASTLMEGAGSGIAVPAAQPYTAEVQSHTEAITKAFNQLYQLIVPKCTSVMESEMMCFHDEVNNVMMMGGTGSYATSLQMNVSSFCNEDLQSMIGRQGFWHPNNKDDPRQYTMFTLLLNISPVNQTEADPGSDIHSGFACSETKETRMKWLLEIIGIWERTGIEDREGFVCYPSLGIIECTSGINATPVQKMGTHSSAPHLRQNRNYAEHGMSVLGGPKAHAQRMAQEILGQAYNDLRAAGLQTESKNWYLEQVSKIYRIEDGQQIYCSTPAWDPDRDAEKIAEPQYKELQCKTIANQNTTHSIVSLEKRYDSVAGVPSTSTAACLDVVTTLEEMNKLDIDKIWADEECDTDGNVLMTVRLKETSPSVTGRHIKVYKRILKQSVPVHTLLEASLPYTLALTMANLDDHPKEMAQVQHPALLQDQNIADAFEGALTPLSSSVDYNTSEDEELIAPATVAPALRIIIPAPTSPKRHYAIGDLNSPSEDESVSQDESLGESKRCFKRQRQSHRLMKEVDEDGMDEDVFEVEAIIGDRFNRTTGEGEYSLRWGTQDETWEPLSHLVGCEELLDAYHREGHVHDQDVAMEHVLGSSLPSMDGPSTRLALGRVWAPSAVSRLAEECHLVTAAIAIVSRAVVPDQQESSEPLAAYWKYYGQHGAAILFHRLSSHGESIQRKYLCLSQTIQSTQRLPSMIHHIAKGEIEDRLTLQETGRALAKLYQWHTIDASELSNVVLNAFKKGSKFLDLSPDLQELAPLMSHILHYLFGAYIAKRTQKSKRQAERRNQRPSNRVPRIQNDPTSLVVTKIPPTLDAVPEDASKLPGNLYRLLPGRKGTISPKART
ncbi:hypothetical protein BKA70DRAFT_1230863 [Coprinopsis sp. MPI-PUGE-AT-0042]|nr:hypothetical protein BKA70DRAFT_1230863 [Coprinopsis sp. MPI-PUGE-AT-0042]